MAAFTSGLLALALLFGGGAARHAQPLTASCSVTSTTTATPTAQTIALGEASKTETVVVTETGFGVPSSAGSVVALISGPGVNQTLAVSHLSDTFSTHSSTYSIAPWTATRTGTYTIAMSYTSSSICSSSATAAITVVQSATTTSLTSSANPIAAGTKVTFSAKVTSSSLTATPVTGSVTFLDGTTSLGSVALSALGTATLTTAALNAGSHSITASYSGDSAHAPSQSAALIERVTAPPPTAAPVPASPQPSTAATATPAATPTPAAEVPLVGNSGQTPSAALLDKERVPPIETIDALAPPNFGSPLYIWPLLAAIALGSLVGLWFAGRRWRRDGALLAPTSHASV